MFLKSVMRRVVLTLAIGIGAVGVAGCGGEDESVESERTPEVGTRYEAPGGSDSYVTPGSNAGSSIPEMFYEPVQECLDAECDTPDLDSDRVDNADGSVDPDPRFDYMRLHGFHLLDAMPTHE